MVVLDWIRSEPEITIFVLVAAAVIALRLWRLRSYSVKRHDRRLGKSGIEFRGHDRSGYYDFSNAKATPVFQLPNDDVLRKTGGRTHPEFGPCLLTIGAFKFSSFVVALVALLPPLIVLWLMWFLLRPFKYAEPAAIMVFVVFLLLALIPPLFFWFRLTCGLRFYRYGLEKYSCISRRGLAYADIGGVGFERVDKVNEYVSDVEKGYRIGDDAFLNSWHYRYVIKFTNGREIVIDSDMYGNRRKFHQKMMFWLENLS